MRLWLFTPASCSSHVLLRGLKSSISLLLYQRNTREEKVFDEAIIDILFPMDEIGTVNPKVLRELFSVHCDWQ
ncbi:unnamed protein product [Camellia sinensis]